MIVVRPVIAINRTYGQAMTRLQPVGAQCSFGYPKIVWCALATISSPHSSASASPQTDVGHTSRAYIARFLVLKIGSP
jgi:hypothetical protein